MFFLILDTCVLILFFKFLQRFPPRVVMVFFVMRQPFNLFKNLRVTARFSVFIFRMNLPVRNHQAHVIIQMIRNIDAVFILRNGNYIICRFRFRNYILKFNNKSKLFIHRVIQLIEAAVTFHFNRAGQREIKQQHRILSVNVKDDMNIAVTDY